MFGRLFEVCGLCGSKQTDNEGPSHFIESNDESGIDEDPMKEKCEVENVVENPTPVDDKACNHVEADMPLPGNMSDSSEEAEELDTALETAPILDRAFPNKRGGRSGKFRLCLIAAGMHTEMMGDPSEWDLVRWQEEVTKLIEILPNSVILEPEDPRIADNKSVQNLLNIIVNEIEDVHGHESANFYQLGYLMTHTCSIENLQLHSEDFMQKWATVMDCFNEIQTYFDEDFVQSMQDISMEVACLESHLDDGIRSSFSGLLCDLPERLEQGLAPNMSIYLVPDSENEFRYDSKVWNQLPSVEEEDEES